MDVTFNVSHEPWIGVVANDGTEIQLGLQDVLLQAHKLHAIRDPIPTVECGIWRLLVAFVLDIFGLHNINELADLRDAGRFDADKVEKYFSRYAGRFDLFDPQRPFLQTPMDGQVEKPLAGLLPLIPSGTNTTHFHHDNEDNFAVSPAAACRILTTIAPFMTAGGAGLPPSINGAPPFYVLLQGETLFETILLNCPVEKVLLPLAKMKGDVPLWRRDEPITACEQRESGVLQSLTWAPRRIQLVPGEAGRCSLTGIESPVLVRTMKFGPGWSSRFENWTDPHVAYRVTAEKRTVLRPQENRPLWRDAGALALLRQKDYESSGNSKIRFERPAVVSQFVEMVRLNELPEEQELNITIYGVRTDLKMKVFEWYCDSLRLPLPLILNRGFASIAQTEMDKADLVAYHMRAIKHAYPRDGAGNKSAFDDLILCAQREFWSALEPHFISGPDSLLRELAMLKVEEHSGQEELMKTWRGVVAKIAKGIFDRTIDDLDADADALERQVTARNIFAVSIRNVLYPELAQKKKSKSKKGDMNV